MMALLFRCYFEEGKRIQKKKKKEKKRNLHSMLIKEQIFLTVS